MKKILILSTITFLFGCSNYRQDIKIEKYSDSTRVVKSFGNKFSCDKTWVILKLDGTFEASFGGDSIEIGNWSLVDGNKILQMVNIRNGDGKGEIRIREFVVVEFDDFNIKLINNVGEKIELKSE